MSWHEITDSTASVSDPDLVADIIETVPPVPDSNQVLVTQILDVKGKPVRTYALRTKTASETQDDSDRLANASALAAYTGLSNSTGTIAERLVRIEKTLAAVVRKVFL